MSSTQLGEAVKDPVCGMSVNPAAAKNKYQHAGQDYFFCCPSCVEKFKADPDKYLRSAAMPASGLVTLGAPLAPGAAPAKEAAPAPSTAYVCPMCPEVRETKAGPCPTCGMALEP